MFRALLSINFTKIMHISKHKVRDNLKDLSNITKAILTSLF